MVSDEVGNRGEGALKYEPGRRLLQGQLQGDGGAQGVAVIDDPVGSPTEAVKKIQGIPSVLVGSGLCRSALAAAEAAVIEDEEGNAELL
jgi:hypothetical protein